MLEAKYRKLSRELFIEVNLNKLITNISINCYQFLGYRKQELIGESIDELLVDKHEIQFGEVYNHEFIFKII